MKEAGKDRDDDLVSPFRENVTTFSESLLLPFFCHKSEFTQGPKKKKRKNGEERCL